MTTSLPKTAKELIERLQRIHFDKAKEREDLITAVRRIGLRLAGRRGISSEDPLSYFDITDLDALDHELVAMRAEAVSVGDGTTKAYISRFRKALKSAGVPMPDGRGHDSLSARWLEVCRASEAVDSGGINAFAKWANNRKIKPERVDGKVFERFSVDYLGRRDGKSGTQTIRRIVDIWNSIATANGLQTVANPLPYVPADKYVFDEEDLHPTVLDELDQFKPKFLGRKKGTFEPTLRRYTRLRYLIRLTVSAFCKETKVEPHSLSSLAQLCEPRNLTLAMRYMVLRAQKKTGVDVRTTAGAYEASRAVRDYADCMLSLAKEASDAIDDIVTTLASGKAVKRDGFGNREKCKSERSGPKQVSCAKRHKMEILSDEEVARSLMGLPYWLYRDFHDNPTKDRRVLTTLAHACALEIMMATSLWGFEVSELRLTALRNVYSEAVGDVEITYDTEEPFVLNETASKVIRIYLELVRPHRPGNDTEFLFPGRRDRSWHRNALANAVRQLVKSQLKLKLSPKDLRAVVGLVFRMRGELSCSELGKYLRLAGAEPSPLLNTIESICAIRSNDESLTYGVLEDELTDADELVSLDKNVEDDADAE